MPYYWPRHFKAAPETAPESRARHPKDTRIQCHTIGQGTSKRHPKPHPKVVRGTRKTPESSAILLAKERPSAPETHTHPMPYHWPRHFKAAPATAPESRARHPQDTRMGRTRQLLAELMGHSFRRQLLEKTLVAAMLTFHPSPRWLKDEGAQITPWVGRKTRGFPKCAPCATRRNRVACPWPVRETTPPWTRQASRHGSVPFAGPSARRTWRRRTSGTCGACARRWSRRRGRGRGAEGGGGASVGGPTLPDPLRRSESFSKVNGSRCGHTGPAEKDLVGWGG